jgi:hypothetical protein
VQSYAWDVGTLCAQNRTHTIHSFDVQNWINRAVEYVKRVRQTFPRSVIMWRTSHAYEAPWMCMSHLLIHGMNAAARSVFPRLGVGLVEWGNMMESYGMNQACHNSLHVSAECNLPDVNLVLNIVSLELA